MDQTLQLGSSIVANAPLLVGTAMPVIVEALGGNLQDSPDKPGGKALERFIFAALMCFFVALFLKWDSLLYGSPEDVLYSFGLIFTESQIVFKTYFEKSWFRSAIQQRVKPNENTEEKVEEVGEEALETPLVVAPTPGG